jgi:HSP20 family protein
MVRDIMPRKRRRQPLGLARRHQLEDNPFLSLHQEMNRMFDDFFGSLESGFDWPFERGLSRQHHVWSPRVDVSENDDEIRVVADVPGLTEQDIHVELSEGYLTIQGEKQDERDEKEGEYRMVERSYGAFHRTIPLPMDLIEDQAKASFKNGVLTITVPKAPAARTSRKQIAITTE